MKSLTHGATRFAIAVMHRALLKEAAGELLIERSPEGAHLRYTLTPLGEARVSARLDEIEAQLGRTI